MNTVLDTNIALDVLLFRDPKTDALKASLDKGLRTWCATKPMRSELQAVLAYPHIERQRLKYANPADPAPTTESILQRFDALVQIINSTPPKAPYACKDADDQKFIDLAAMLKCPLISKDKQVLKMKKRLERLGVLVLSDSSSFLEQFSTNGWN